MIDRAELEKVLASVESTDGPAVLGALVQTVARLMQPVPVESKPVEVVGGEDPYHRARCLSPEKIAEIIPGLGVSKIREMLRTRRLPGYKEGKCWLVPLVALEEYVSQRLDVATFPRKKLRAVK